MSKTNDTSKLGYATLDDHGKFADSDLDAVTGGCPPAIIAGVIILAGTLAFDIAAGVFDPSNWSVGSSHTERPL